MSLDLAEGRTFIIAEAATGHADFDYAKRFDKAIRLVRAAQWAGADAIKFQWFTDPPGGWHGLKKDMFCWIEGDEARAIRWKHSELDPEQWTMVKQYAEACGLVFLASAFQMRTVLWLVKLGLQATKVASRAAKSFPYDTEGLPQPFLVSYGMFRENECPVRGQVIGFQCEAKYPSTQAWPQIADDGTARPGFSDHSGKPFLGIDAIARGCKLLEVHFMLEHTDAGPDLPACLTLEELDLVCQARDYYAKRTA
jgi:sialic acid synthase SpsE